MEKKPLLAYLKNPLENLENLIFGGYFDRFGRPGRWVGRVLGYAYAVMRDFFNGELNLRAMSLVYTTLLSIVPLLAFSFALLKGFGVFDQLKPYLTELLAPLGEQGDRITQNLLNLVDNVRGGLLGGVSMLILLWTVISTIQKVESSFNYVWYVSKPRSMSQRITEYLVVLTIGPVMMVVAISLIGSMSSNAVVQYLSALPGVGETLLLLGKLMPFVIITGVFTFLYMFMPNTRVKLASALVGGLGGGVMWAAMAVFFTTFVVTAVRTQNMYANFAIAIFALLWLYLNWLVLLIGAQLAFYHQNPAFLRIGRQEPRLSNAMRERLALNIMLLVGSCYRQVGARTTMRQIGSQLNIPTIAVAPVAQALEEANLLVTAEDESVVPGRDPALVKLSDILDVVRAKGETGSHRDPTWSPSIVSMGDQLDSALSASVGDTTLARFLDQSEKR